MLSLILAAAVLAIAFYVVVNFAPVGWRTIMFNVVAAIPLVGGELASALTGFDWGKVVSSSQTAALLGVGVLALNIVLRTMTTGPIGTQE